MVWRKPWGLDHLHAGLPGVALWRVRLCTYPESMPSFEIADCAALRASIIGNNDTADYSIELLEADRERVPNLDDYAIACLQNRCPLFFALLDWTTSTILAWSIQDY